MIRCATKTSLTVALVAFAAGLTSGPWLSSELHAQVRNTTNTELLRANLGDWCGGKEIRIEIQEAGPGTSGRHYHPGHAFAWVVSGSFVRTIDGEGPRPSNAGDVIHEEPMQISETRNTVPVKALIFRLVEPGKPNTVSVP